jgi:hypothetical protein
MPDETVCGTNIRSMTACCQFHTVFLWIKTERITEGAMETGESNRIRLDIRDLVKQLGVRLPEGMLETREAPTMNQYPIRGERDANVDTRCLIPRPDGTADADKGTDPPIL